MNPGRLLAIVALAAGEPRQWAAATNTTGFLFEAFDEPWKGDPDNPLDAEKHWGLFSVDRTAKEAMR